jgi:hypothetical protein
MEIKLSKNVDKTGASATKFENERKIKRSSNIDEMVTSDNKLENLISGFGDTHQGA